MKRRSFLAFLGLAPVTAAARVCDQPAQLALADGEYDAETDNVTFQHSDGVRETWVDSAWTGNPLALSFQVAKASPYPSFIRMLSPEGRVVMRIRYLR